MNLQLLKNKANKIEYAIELLNLLNSKDLQEAILIEDNGSIVRSDRLYSTWFQEILQSDQLSEKIIFYVVSMYRPVFNNKLSEYLVSVYSKPLNAEERKVFFYAYKEKLELIINDELDDFLLSKYTGSPNQIIHSLNLIFENKSDITDIKKDISNILKESDGSGPILYKKYDSDTFAQNLLVLLSKFDYISFDLIYEILDDFDTTEKYLTEFYISCMLEKIGSNAQYVKLNKSISNYIQVVKIKLNDITEKKLRKITSEYISNDDTDATDLSFYLYSRKIMILDSRIKSKMDLLIPSVIIKSIKDIYYEGKYSDVVILCNEFLKEKSAYYGEIEREVRYFLCLSLARESKTEFVTEIRYFKNIETEQAAYNFLYGFYHSRKMQYEDAEKRFRKSLTFSDNNVKTINELVIALLGQDKFESALELAEKNYKNNEDNDLCVELYFRCLVRKILPKKSETDTLEELLAKMKYLVTSGTAKTSSTKMMINITMNAEYEFYINKQYAAATQSIYDILDSDNYKNKKYAAKALVNFYKKLDNKEMIKKTFDKYREHLPHKSNYQTL